ncbi:hypothetical protein BK004_01565 [bacterium CG10_46_32]|nr:MAG: hypothetical protein BK004_01565 [bacterium CG10_46_32]
MMLLFATPLVASVQSTTWGVVKSQVRGVTKPATKPVVGESDVVLLPQTPNGPMEVRGNGTLRINIRAKDMFGAESDHMSRVHFLVSVETPGSDPHPREFSASLTGDTEWPLCFWGSYQAVAANTSGRPLVLVVAVQGMDGDRSMGTASVQLVQPAYTPPPTAVAQAVAVSYMSPAEPLLPAEKITVSNTATASCEVCVEADAIGTGGGGFGSDGTTTVVPDAGTDLNPRDVSVVSYPGDPKVYFFWWNPRVQSLESFWIYRSEVPGERGELVNPPSSFTLGSRDAGWYKKYVDATAEQGVWYFYTVLLRDIDGTYSTDTTQYEVVSGPGWGMPIKMVGRCSEGDMGMCDQIIGQAPGATDNYDGQDVEFESLPPDPPSDIPYMSFHMWNDDLDVPERTAFDIRSDAERSMEFVLYFNPGHLGAPFTFTWDTSQLPEDATGEVAFVFRNEDGEEVIHQTYADIRDGEVTLLADSFAMKAGMMMFVIHRNN